MWLLFISTFLFAVLSHVYTQDVCDDSNIKCALWKDYCTQDSFKYYMELNCKRTCGWCPKCEDISPNCHLYTSFCEHKDFKDYLKKNCSKSCNFCAAPTTQPTPPIPVTPTWKVVPSGDCGSPKVLQGRVINGVDAKKGAWPWQIMMRFIGESHCGGSIISPFWVATAAHCVEGKEALINEFKIVVGEHDTRSDEGTETEIGITKIIVHEGYQKPSSFNNDIALVKLSRPVPFDSNIGTVCLPNQGQTLEAGTECFITGWGWISNIPWKGMHHTLQQAKLPVAENSKCHSLNVNSTTIPVTSKMVCGGFGQSSPTGGCHGDSGGPFVCRTGPNGKWELHGLVSWGSADCDTKEAYTVFARVSEFRDWIDQKIAAN